MVMPYSQNVHHVGSDAGFKCHQKSRNDLYNANGQHQSSATPTGNNFAIAGARYISQLTSRCRNLSTPAIMYAATKAKWRS